MENLKMLTAAVDAIDAVGAKVLPEKICKLVRKHAFAAAGASVLPVPGAAEVALVGNTWLMYKNINDELGLKLSENKLKTIASGVIANIGVSTLLAVGAAELFKFVPGLGSMAGAALDLAMFAAITYTSAYVYLKCITKLARLSQFGAGEIENADVAAEVKTYMAENKKEISGLLKSAKKEFKGIKKGKGEAEEEMP